MVTLAFKDCSRLDLERKFNLEQVDTLDVLEDWIRLSNDYQIDDYENKTLMRLQEQLKFRVDDWNEQELVENFIAPLLSLICFNTRKYGMFSWRTISATIGDYILTGNPDIIIAKGRREPEIPYFCFHEYKKENEPKGDPAGQCLAAMLVAQELNNNRIPIFGIVVKGLNWYYIVLEGEKYSISKPYQAVDAEIYVIVKLLKHLKTIFDGYVK